MGEEKLIRLGQASRKLNIGHNTIIDFLAKRGFSVENNPNAKLSPEQFAMLAKQFASSANEKAEASGLIIGVNRIEATPIKTEQTNQNKEEKVDLEKPKLENIKVLGKIELIKREELKTEEKQTEKKVVDVTPGGNPEVSELELIKASAGSLKGLKVVSEIILPNETHLRSAEGKRSRQRIGTDNIDWSLKYNKGDVITSTIKQLISPSQIITELPGGFIGRLSILDISWCLPEGEKQFENLKIGDEIKCKILDVDLEKKQIRLSHKNLSNPLSDTIRWQRIERGDEFKGKVREVLNDSVIIETEKNLYGLSHKSYLNLLVDDFKVKVNSKDDISNLLLFVPASVEIENKETEEINIESEFNFIDDDLISYNSFRRSLIGLNSSDKDHEIIRKGFEIDPKIFSKEISHKYTVYIQFERNNPSYENIFKQNAIPYYLQKDSFSPEDENSALAILSTLTYWFRINQRPFKNSESELITEFSIYNEDVSFFGEVVISKDKKEYRFVIRNFSFGHSALYDNLHKKRETKEGSFLLVAPLKVLNPLMNLPIGNKQKEFIEKAIIKKNCFDLIEKLKLDSGEILRQEGRTLAIMDKFLEYQMNLIEDQKDSNVFVERFEQIPSESNGIAIKIPRKVGDSLEIEEEVVVNIRLKQNSLKTNQEEEFVRLTDGVLSFYQNQCKIVFLKDINLDLLKSGFYVDKRISKRQFQIQREIIQDFLQKRIKIDHIESLLVNPENTKTPILANLNFFNSDLERTEKEQPDNNQVKAVKKAIGNQNIFLIQGPPGTGKTTVIAEIIEQLVSKGEKILVSGQNHVAVDNVLEKLSKIPSLNLLRVGNPDRINKELIGYSIDNLLAEYKVDFNTFLKNQILLTRKFHDLKNQGITKEEVLLRFNQRVNELSEQYGKLKNVYKQRHFILRDGLAELSGPEIMIAIDSLNKWIESSENEHEILLKPLIYGSLDVVFATCIGIKTDQVFRDSAFKFDTVIIDEAGKANIAETLVAIELGRKVILVGDQKQLPPYIDSSLIDEKEESSFPKSIYGSDFTQDEILHALKTSFFEFIISRIRADKFPKANLEMLNYQHRMHPNIGHFVSNSFYDGLIQMGSRTHLNRIILPTPFDKEVIFFDTSNSQDSFEQTDGYSAKNNTEAASISEVILPRLFENNISPSSIAVITPYKSQVSNIQKHIHESDLCNFKNIDISTLDSFQGKEYDIIIISFTRASDHKRAPIVNGRKRYTKVGFLDDARRLNVAFSRAKKKLILVGNASTLVDSKSHYDGLFNYTNLFERLVSLSKQENIGNFVNIVNYFDTQKHFESFIAKYKIGDTVTGVVKLVLKKNEITYRIIVTIDKIDCILNTSSIPGELRENMETLTKGNDLAVIISEINSSIKRVYVKLKPSIQRESIWDTKIKTISIGDSFKGRVKGKVNFGYFVELEFGIDGLLHKSNVRNKIFAVGQIINVKVLKIDKQKRQIALSI